MAFYCQQQNIPESGEKNKEKLVGVAIVQAWQHQAEQDVQIVSNWIAQEPIGTKKDVLKNE